MSIYALLIGIDTYKDETITNLSYAGADVSAFGEKLTGLLGVPRKNIHLFTSKKGTGYATDQSILNRFSKLCRIMEPEDSFIFYFAGHGIEKYKDLYLFTANTNPFSHITFKKSSIQLSDLQEELKESRVQKRLFIMDACRKHPDRGRSNTENRLTETMSRTIAMMARASRDPELDPVVGLMYSCKEKQIAHERRELGHGVFSYFMLQGMDKLVKTYGVIQLGQLKSYIDREMKKWCRANFPAGLKQQPWLDIHGDVPELTPLKKAPAEKPAQQPPAYRPPARLSMEELKETGLLEEYLINGGKLYGTPFFTFFKALRSEFEIDSAGQLKELLKELQAREKAQKLAGLLKKAQACLNKTDYQDTLTALEDLLTLDGSHSEALALKVRTEDILRDMEERKRQKITDLLQKAQSSFKSQDYQSAIYALEDLLTFEGSHSEALALKKAAEAAVRKQEVLTDLGIRLIKIPGGSFDMGDVFNDGDSDEKPVHRVTLSSYFMSETPVTFAQYDTYCKATGKKKPDDRGWGRGDRPVINVSWDEAAGFCAWLSEQTGRDIRLPTEAQWEYAARSGGKKERYAGTSNAGELGRYAWFDTNSGGKTHPVKGKQPNGLGLYDMTGNVWEWCQDFYGSNYYKNSPGKDPQGPESGSNRVKRGGAWSVNTSDLHSWHRYSYGPASSSLVIGFRVVSTD